jgi:hypothetical protein
MRAAKPLRKGGIKRERSHLRRGTNQNLQAVVQYGRRSRYVLCRCLRSTYHVQGPSTGFRPAQDVVIAHPAVDALRECRRSLAPGGWLALTCWEATNLADERLPQWARRIDLMRDLTEAGFERVDVAISPDGVRPSATCMNRPSRPAIQRSSPCKKMPAGASSCSRARAGFARRPLRRADPRLVR